MRKQLIKSPFYEPITRTFMSEKTKLTLTIGERLAALKLFDAFKGGLSTLASLVDDVKLFTMTEAEWTKAELTKTPTDAEIATMPQEVKEKTNQTWKWKEEGNEKDIEVQEPTLKYLKDEIKKKDDAGEITLADVALVGLLKKL